VKLEPALKVELVPASQLGRAAKNETPVRQH
jgi:hypothetical protein